VSSRALSELGYIDYQNIEDLSISPIAAGSTFTGSTIGRAYHHFQGRKLLLERMQTLLWEPANEQKTLKVMCIFGLGGCGKTQLVLKYIEENLVLYVS